MNTDMFPESKLGTRIRRTIDGFRLTLQAVPEVHQCNGCAGDVRGLCTSLPLGCGNNRIIWKPVGRNGTAWLAANAIGANDDQNH